MVSPGMLYLFSRSGNGRSCPFGHKWRLRAIDQALFVASDRCTWCGKVRERALTPGDEQALSIRSEQLQWLQVRQLLINELKYQKAKGDAANLGRVVELEAELKSRQQWARDELKRERAKGNDRSGDRIEALKHESFRLRLPD
jgi:hypothetical protein